MGTAAGFMSNSSDTENFNTFVNQSLTVSGNAVVDARRNSGNIRYNLGAGSQWRQTINNGLGRDDMEDLLGSLPQFSMSITDPAKKSRVEQNNELAEQEKDVLGPKAIVRWILYALAAVALIGAGVLIWNRKT